MKPTHGMGRPLRRPICSPLHPQMSSTMSTQMRAMTLMPHDSWGGLVGYLRGVQASPKP
jgi:hypothetical protein